jgi:hypothetical protein
VLWPNGPFEAELVLMEAKIIDVTVVAAGLKRTEH